MDPRVAEWKRTYGRVFRIKLEGKDVYYRPLSCRELIRAKEAPDDVAKVVQESVILNDDVKLSLPGSLLTLSSHVMKISVLEDGDELVQTALENRFRVQENFSLNLISRICGIFPYKPDELLGKTLHQLLQIVAVAEVTTGKHIIKTGDEPKGPPKQPSFREDGKFTPPQVDELMNDSSDALAATMRKEGQNVKQFSKKPKSDDPLTNQMDTLNDFTK